MNRIRPARAAKDITQTRNPQRSQLLIFSHCRNFLFSAHARHLTGAQGWARLGNTCTNKQGMVERSHEQKMPCKRKFFVMKRDILHFTEQFMLNLWVNFLTRKGQVNILKFIFSEGTKMSMKLWDEYKPCMLETIKKTAWIFIVWFFQEKQNCAFAAQGIGGMHFCAPQAALKQKNYHTSPNMQRILTFFQGPFKFMKRHICPFFYF